MDGQMPVKITFSPIKELVVHEVIEMDRDDLLRERITPSGNMPLYWCSGMLLSFSSLPFTEGVVKDYLEGRIHWAEVHFSKMDEYSPILQLNDEVYRSAMVRIIDTSSSSLHKGLSNGLLRLQIRKRMVIDWHTYVCTAERRLRNWRRTSSGVSTAATECLRRRGHR